MFLRLPRVLFLVCCRHQVLPCLIGDVRRHSLRTPGRCVVTIQVFSGAFSSIFFRSFFSVSSSSAEVASSRRITGALRSNARAMAIRCDCPSESPFPRFTQFCLQSFRQFFDKFPRTCHLKSRLHFFPGCLLLWRYSDSRRYSRQEVYCPAEHMKSIPLCLHLTSAPFCPVPLRLPFLYPARSSEDQTQQRCLPFSGCPDKCHDFSRAGTKIRLPKHLFSFCI